MRWYVAATEPNHEVFAKSALERAGFSTFLPILLERIVDSRGRAYSRRSPMFPSYLFTEFDIDDSSYRRVYRQPGIRSLLPFKNEPLPLPVGMIEGIQSKVRTSDGCVAMEEFDDVGNPVFEEDQEVHVTRGAFAGFTAVYKGMAGDRVKALLSVFGHQMFATMPQDCVVSA